MSSLSVRTGNAGTANVDTITLPDGSSAVGHVALGADGNPIVLAADASVEALASAVVAGLAAVQERAALKPVVTAGIALSGQIALMFDLNGNAIPADPTLPGYAFAGISLAAGALGTLVPVALAGPVADLAWTWTPRQPVFAAPGGVLTQAVPTTGILHQLGIATTATTIFLAPGPPILRS